MAAPTDVWLVERRLNQFDRVTGVMTVHASGALLFGPSIWCGPTTVIAPGQWISVVQDDDAND